LPRSKHRKEKPGFVRFQKGDAIRGEIILARARKWDDRNVVADSGEHRIQQAKLRGEAFAIIDRQFSYIPNDKRIQ